MRFLVLERDHPGSIAACVDRARENVRSVRELVSSELWESVNDRYLAMGSRDLDHGLTDRPQGLFSFVRRSSMTIYGVASETMPRDECWRFMALGRLLERAEMTCRLLEVRYPQLERLAEPSRRLGTSTDEQPRGADRTDFHHGIAVLKSASAFEAYRRRDRASMDPVDVVEFLLLEPDLPRSVRYCLLTARAQVAELCGGVASPAARRPRCSSVTSVSCSTSGSTSSSTRSRRRSGSSPRRSPRATVETAPHGCRSCPRSRWPP